MLIGSYWSGGILDKYWGHTLFLNYWRKISPPRQAINSACAAQSLQSGTTRSSVMVIYLDPRSVPTHNGRNADEPLEKCALETNASVGKGFDLQSNVFVTTFQTPPPVPHIPYLYSDVNLDWRLKICSRVSNWLCSLERKLGVRGRHGMPDFGNCFVMTKQAAPLSLIRTLF